MLRMTLRMATVLTMMLGMIAVSGVVVAQDAVPAHPSHIHSGTCDSLDPSPAYPLNDVAAVSPDAPAGAVEVAHSVIDTTLDELLASPYALNIHESAENVEVYIACGNVAGPVVDGLLLIPLREQSDSGYYGIAALATNETGGTNVSVYVAPEGSGTAIGTPAAMADMSQDEADVGSADSATAQEVTVDITDFVFAPQVIEIEVGTTVTWTNNDVTQHTATANDEMWDSGILGQGESFSFTFEEPGTFDYICTLHPNMTGQVVVTAP